MYALLEDAWQDPLLVPSERGFVLHPRRRPEFLAATHSSTEPAYETSPPAPMPPAIVPQAYAPRRVRMPLEEGFEGTAPPRNTYGWPSSTPTPRDDVLRELQRLREELEWIRQDRGDIQRRLDFVCALLFGLAVLLFSDLIRRWTPSK